MKYGFLLVGLILFGACSEPKGPREFYGKIVYTVTVGGIADSALMQELRAAYGDSVAVYFTDKGYKLEVYNEAGFTEWFENSSGMHYQHRKGERVFSVGKSKEANSLLAATKRVGSSPRVLGRDCGVYSMQDNQFHIEMWYDSSLYISPTRFDNLVEGHYYQYYADCKAPYLVRSMVMPPINIRIEAIRIEQWDEPDPAWSFRPDYPRKPIDE